MKQAVAWGARLLLAALFFYAGAIKAWDPPAFAAMIHPYRLLPDAAVNLSALTLPWIEMLAAVAILLPRWRRGAALLIAGLLLVFLLAELSVLHRGLAIACGCFSLTAGGTPVGPVTLARNLALLACALLAMHTPRTTAPSEWQANA